MNTHTFIIVHAEFGIEEFEIKSARYHLYQAEGGFWELTLSIEAGAAIQRAGKLLDLIDARPSFEATAILNANQLDLYKGRQIEQKEGYDHQRGEVLSNGYYFTHERIEELHLEILDINVQEMLANVRAEGVINGSHGSEPDAEFILKEVSFKHDRSLFREVM